MELAAALRLIKDARAVGLPTSFLDDLRWPLFCAADRVWHDADPLTTVPCLEYDGEELLELTLDEMASARLCSVCLDLRSVDPAYLDYLEDLRMVVDLRRASKRLRRTRDRCAAVALMRLYGGTNRVLWASEPEIDELRQESRTRAEEAFAEFRREHGEILTTGVLVGLRQVYLTDPATSDPILEVLARRHHDPLHIRGRVVVRVTEEESRMLWRGVKALSHQWWSSREEIEGREAELEALWQEGVGGGRPEEALRVLQALAA